MAYCNLYAEFISNSLELCVLKHNNLKKRSHPDSSFIEILLILITLITFACNLYNLPLVYNLTFARYIRCISAILLIVLLSLLV